MKPMKLYAEYRASIISIIAGVEDTGYGLRWDETTPNSTIKRKLYCLRDAFLQDAKLYGFHIVRRHKHCGSPRHKRAADENEYIMDTLDHVSIKFGDKRYLWQGPIEQGEEYCTCPCNKTGTIRKHWIFQDVVFEVGSDHTVCEIIHDVFQDIYLAIDSAADHTPRSAIRENLLRAILKLNDALLPTPMEDYIRKSLNDHSFK